MSFFITILEQGLIYGILALGVYITYKILDFPDLTVDGSFSLGAAVTAALITRGVNPYLTLPAAFLIGVLAGVCTGLIHVKGKVRDLLSGIIILPEPPMFRFFPRRQSLRMILLRVSFRMGCPGIQRFC